VRALFRLLSLFPLPVLHAVGGLLGWLLWIIPNDRRKVALINIRRCFPALSDTEVRRRARRALGHEMKTIAELPLLWMGPAHRVERLVRRIDRPELVDQALAKGKGLILLTLHQGSFEAPAIVYSRQHVMTGLYKRQKGVFEDLSLQGRTRFGGRMIPAEGSVVLRALLPLLRGNHIAYILPDQDPPPGRGIYSPLFGIPAHTPTLIAKLAKSTGAQVLFFIGERLPRSRGYVMRFVEAPDGIHDPDLQTATDAMNQGVEQCIRALPDQYWWGYKRFRRRPDGSSDFYD